MQRFAEIAVLLSVILPATLVRSAELLMLEQPGCAWCVRFNNEITPAYAKTKQGKKAPLRHIDITQPWPEDLAHIASERFTPSFVLIEKGVEIDRMRGYHGPDFFWFLLDEMLAKLPAPDQS